MQVCDEVECLEKTLLKRRAELRQADRLLLEAQSCINTSRQQVSEVQLEADVLQHRAQENVTCLQEKLRQLQLEVQQLRMRRQQEQQVEEETQSTADR
ncbi:centriolin-like [Stegastes partitus]|uniref:Centriolin-like n=1 Tax=Stegastes partitus TaxID=144197 RepID=A0A9Y4U1Y7_9TELE|nr:PREDICTED: centriolin-like [Stegastes partitus]